MGVDLLRGTLVQSNKSGREVVASGLQIRPTGVIREEVGNWRSSDLLTEKIDFVEEQND
jgi:hypothetical protein